MCNLMDVSTSITALDEQSAADASRVWWVFLVTGSLWILFSILVFRFSWTSDSSISILFGIAMLGAAATELLAMTASHGWWKIGRLALALALVVIAIVSFVHPGNTFKALAAVISFAFIVKGIFDLV